MRKCILLMTLLGSSMMQGRQPGISVDTVPNYKSWGWNAIVMQNDIITLAVVPDIGGRIMQYDLGSHSSIFINPAETGKTYTPSPSAPWHNFGGYKTWPSPQSAWPGNWPPPPTLDCGKYTSQIDSLREDSISVFVSSPVEQWTAPGLRFERKATMYRGTSRVTLEQTLVNAGTGTIHWGMWSIMQTIVHHPDETDYDNFWIYFPVNPNSAYGITGVQPNGPSESWKGEVAPGIYGVQFHPDDKLIYADPHKGWIAYTDLRDSIVYATTFDIFEGASYPDHARVTAYVSQENPAYFEVEVKAPVVDLLAGERYTFVENWWAAKVRAPIIDVNSTGAIAQKLTYTPDIYRLSAVYGIFHQGTARVVVCDAQDQVLMEGDSMPVSPLTEFHLQTMIGLPDSAKTVEVRIYDTNDTLIGIVDRANVSDLITDVPHEKVELPSGFELRQNYPNPFNPATTIGYTLPEQSSVQIIIYDLLGREIKTLPLDHKPQGSHEVIWDGTNNQGSAVSAGTYICRVRAALTRNGQGVEMSAKMVLLK